jgi:hypothetical protein
VTNHRALTVPNQLHIPVKFEEPEYRNGTYIWTTPTGHQYTREPEPIAQPATPQPPKPEPERANPNDEPPPF